MAAKPLRIKTAYLWLPLTLLCITAVIAAFQDPAREVLRYENTFAAKGEYWRLITAHFTHLGRSHLWLNMAGLFLVWLLYGAAFSNRVWSALILGAAGFISVAFYVFDSDLQHYVGLSGVLHGMIAAGALGQINKRAFGADTRIAPEDVFVFFGLWAKIIYEQTVGAVPMTQSLAGGSVVVNAHLYGALFGTLCVLVYAGLKMANHKD